MSVGASSHIALTTIRKGNKKTHQRESLMGFKQSSFYGGVGKTR